MSSTILIVDDNRDNLTVIGGLLKGEYHVRVANSGERALQVAVTQPIPDLILLDIMMPGMDGYETLRHLRQMPETRDIPVIFVTAMSADEDEEAGLGLGAVDYVTKPIRPAILSARVRTHLALTQARQAVSTPGYWADHELALLIMPIARTAEQRQLDLQAHAVALTETAAVAA